MITRGFALIASLLLTGCAGLTSLIQAPKSVGERNSGFAYIPLDPLPVYIEGHPSCKTVVSDGRLVLAPGYEVKPLLDSLPDNAVRIAVKEYNSKGNLSFGGSSVGTEGNRYQVILDYINVDTSNIRFLIRQPRPGSDQQTASSVAEVSRISGPSYVDRDRTYSAEALEKLQGNTVIPVYVGVGLRLTADLQVLKGTVNLSSLGAIAAGVEAGRASGSLVVQTLGITGKQVSTALPLPSELNQTTVQNAILSLGSIKAIIFDAQNTNTTPRVTGMYLPIRDASEDLVNRIVSELAREAIPWAHPCVYKPAPQGPISTQLTLPPASAAASAPAPSLPR